MNIASQACSVRKANPNCYQPEQRDDNQPTTPNPDLYLTFSKSSRVWRRSELIQEVWDYEYVGDQRVVDVHIGQIRKKEIDATQPLLIKRGVAILKLQSRQVLIESWN